MKKILLILGIIFTSTGLAQTKEETIDWLNRYLDEYHSTDSGEKYTVDTAFGYRIVIVATKTKKFYSFDAKDISRISTTRKLRTDKVNGNLDLEFYSKDGVIWTSKQDFIDSLIIPLEADNDTVERIQKGFIHLLALFGNKLETEKEFFKN